MPQLYNFDFGPEARQALFVRLGLATDVPQPAIHTGLVERQTSQENLLEDHSPVDGSLLAQVCQATTEDYARVAAIASKGAKAWAAWPAPKRGEVVRAIGETFRKSKQDLATLMALEMGKTLQEALGEVQEVVDICDFAVGLSRQLYGLTMPSERPQHRLYEQWHPLGVVGVISAFNFPVAVWGWNAMIAAVCGNATLWKPSEKAPLTALAAHRILEPVLHAHKVPEGVFTLLIGDAYLGKAMAADPQVALISATGSTRMGKSVAETVAKRLGKTLLELGGNNAIILTPSANLDLAIRAIVFAAVGTSGQRCTTARRLLVHSSLFDSVKERLVSAYEAVANRMGHPLAPEVLLGPLIDRQAVVAVRDALIQVQEEGGKLLVGGAEIRSQGLEGGYYITPALVEAQNHYAAVQRETFGPILYMIPYETLEDAIKLQNAVPQGLSSSIFSNDIRETERFLSAQGSDCGIANVNIGPSGAEIGGAFGGEKETGGGRESGSDAWKAYMRRQTVTINYSSELPLAQGISFDL